MVQFSVQGTWLRRQNVSAIIKSDLQLIALDIQGVGFEVFDPEIASAKNIDENNAFHLFCAGNIGSNAINKFLDEHVSLVIKTMRCSLPGQFILLPAQMEYRVVYSPTHCFHKKLFRRNWY